MINKKENPEALEGAPTGMDINNANTSISTTANKECEAEKEAINTSTAAEAEAKIKQLSKLSRVEYDRVRIQKAKELNVRLSTLDAEIERLRGKGKAGSDSASKICKDVEPCDEGIRVSELLDDIFNLIRIYVVCSSATMYAATLWIAMTWFISDLSIAPIAMITAPDKRCGKSTLLDIMGRLSRRTLKTSNISPAALFRIIEAECPTLFIDEADTFLRDNEQLRGILNSGHTRQSAYVIRTVGDMHTPTQFSTFGAKAISGIGLQAETLMDRSIVLKLRRKLSNETVESLRNSKPKIFESLSRQLARFAADYAEEVAQARPDMPVELNDRAADNWEPLLAIADIAGSGWPIYARRAAVEISGDAAATPSINEELLLAIKLILEKQDEPRIWLSNLQSLLVADLEAPWATWKNGRPMTVHQLSRKLKEFGVQPKSVRMGEKVGKGFEADDFKDAFTRYLGVTNAALPPETTLSTVTELQHNNINEMDEEEIEFSDALEIGQLHDNSLENNNCNWVTEHVHWDIDEHDEF